MLIFLLIFSYAPEDSNAHYLMDKQLAHYFPAWDGQFDSTTNAFRTSQGCLDFWHWYIDLETKVTVNLCSWLGLRYRNEYHGDYDNHVANHYFEPFIMAGQNLRLLFTIAPHYYKGEDEIGIGFSLGKSYLNYFQTLFIVEDFDRNYSFKDIPDGADKIIYQQFPIKSKTILNQYWRTGYCTFSLELTNRYWLRSTELTETYPTYFYERGLKRSFYTRINQDLDAWRFGLICDLAQSERSHIDTSQVHKEDIFEMILEPTVAYRINDQWMPTLYLTYNYKTDNDSLVFFNTDEDYWVDYQRDIYAYLFDLVYCPRGNFLWHFGMQQQFYHNNQGDDTRERRFILGFEYRYNKVWLYVVEAMEGDFPMPHWLHNRTYVQLLLKL